MMKLITIYFDYTNDSKNRAYAQVLEDIKNNVADIHTCCTDFFSSSTLDKGYDVKVINRNDEYILLSELLANQSYKYTRRIMKKGHNLRQLLLSGEFKWQKNMANLD